MVVCMDKHSSLKSSDGTLGGGAHGEREASGGGEEKKRGGGEGVDTESGDVANGGESKMEMAVDPRINTLCSKVMLVVVVEVVVAAAVVVVAAAAAAVSSSSSSSSAAAAAAAGGQGYTLCSYIMLVCDQAFPVARCLGRRKRKEKKRKARQRGV